MCSLVSLYVVWRPLTSHTLSDYFRPSFSERFMVPVLSGGTTPPFTLVLRKSLRSVSVIPPSPYGLLPLSRTSIHSPIDTRRILHTKGWPLLLTPNKEVKSLWNLLITHVPRPLCRYYWVSGTGVPPMGDPSSTTYTPLISSLHFLTSPLLWRFTGHDSTLSLLTPLSPIVPPRWLLRPRRSVELNRASTSHIEVVCRYKNDK